MGSFSITESIKMNYYVCSILLKYIIFILSIIVSHKIKCKIVDESKPETTPSAGSAGASAASAGSAGAPAASNEYVEKCVNFRDIQPTSNKFVYVYAVIVAVATGISILVFMLSWFPRFPRFPLFWNLNKLF